MCKVLGLIASTARRKRSRRWKSKRKRRGAGGGEGEGELDELIYLLFHFVVKMSFTKKKAQCQMSLARVNILCSMLLCIGSFSCTMVTL
jgi:hypothetical protein